MCVQSLVSAEWTGGCLERATVLITTDGPDLLAPETTPLASRVATRPGLLTA